MRDEVLERAREELDAQPDNPNLIINYAHHLLSTGQTDLAIEMARRAEVIAPDDFRVRRFLSSAFSVAGDLNQAASAAESAVRINPTDPEVRIHLAGLMVALQRPRAAVPHLMAVTSGVHETPYAWRLLSTALTELGRPDRAIAAIDRAIELSPNEVEFRIHRASLLINRGRHQEALEELAIATQQDPSNASVWRTRSGLLEVLERSGEALANAEQAVTLEPENAEFRAHLSFLRLQAGLSDTPSVLDLDELAESWVGTSPAAERPYDGLVTNFGGAIKLQAQVIRSLMLRDMRTRFGRSRLGYFWAIMEPIGHLLTLGSVFAFLNHGHPPLGTDLYIFYVTGLIPFLMFSHVVVEMMPVLASNVAVLSLPIVKNIDVMIAKAVLALATDLFVAVVVFSGFVLLGRPGVPQDLLTCMIAMVSIWLLSVGFGMINLIVAELFHTWEAIIGAVMRLMYFASGIYYSPLMMPAWVRDILVWNPVLQAVELFRSGFFRQYQPHWLDRSYLFIWIIVTLLIGFSLERVLRRRLVVFG